jgi:hypothetical protein
VKENHLRILNIERFPACYGVRIAQDCMDNKTLNKYWSDFLKVAGYYSLLGPLGKPFVEPIQGQYVERIMEIIDEELEKRRWDEVEKCAVCDLRGGCMISALFLIIDPKRWFTKDPPQDQGDD